MSNLSHRWLVLLVAAGCSTPSVPVTVDPIEAAADADSSGKADGAGPAIPEIRCTGQPAVGPAGKWRHPIKSRVDAALGSPRHRGIDLVAAASAGTQTILGELRYGDVDKALEDEAVDIWACRSSQWLKIGTAITDDNGNFSFNLTGSARFPVAIRALWLSVVGDRSATEMTAVVAPDSALLAVSDIDGTLTSSENAFPDSLISGAAVAGHPGEATALSTLRQRGYVVVYTTARGRYFTGDTRAWLEGQGLPRGPLRLASSLVTLPGQATINYKVSAMNDLGGLTVDIGIGNRATDGAAYAAVGVPADRIFLETPEFAREIQPLLDNGSAVGFDDWTQLVSVFASL